MTKCGISLILGQPHVHKIISWQCVKSGKLGTTPYYFSSYDAARPGWSVKPRLPRHMLPSYPFPHRTSSCILTSVITPYGRFIRVQLLYGQHPFGSAQGKLAAILPWRDCLPASRYKIFSDIPARFWEDSPEEWEGVKKLPKAVRLGGDIGKVLQRYIF
jgi:hypothetical protein